MDEFWKTVTAPSWWISVVVVGIVINLISAYMKEPLDSFISKFISSFRLRNQEARAAYNAQVRSLSRSTDQQFVLLLEALKYRTQAYGWMTVSVLCFVVYIADTLLIGLELSSGQKLRAVLHWHPYAGVMGIIFLVFAAFYAQRCINAANNRERLVRAARDLRGGA